MLGRGDLWWVGAKPSFAFRLCCRALSGQADPRSRRLTAPLLGCAIPAVPQLSLQTPFGALTLSEEDGALVALDWGWGRDQADTALLRRARDQLNAYLDGELRRFDLPLRPAGSAYQRRVWQALGEIPFGETRSYAQLAAAAGGSARSVGQANSLNPLPVIVPCHRVVAARGLGGYSGAEGPDTKRALLALEAAASVRVGTPALATPRFAAT
jgi:methylated-DNA-[protein]-cysteine S-methyltransferase